jgi:ribosomal-protein-serine acetyltransferase
MVDVEDLYPRLIAEQSDLIMINSIDHPSDVQDLEKEIKRVNGQLKEGVRLGGAVEFEGGIVGSCRIAHIQNGQSGDLGYWLFREARGKGLITSCTRSLLDIAFNRIGLSMMTIGAAEKNIPSVAVARRLGFTLREVKPKYLERGGKLWDTAIYEMPVERWKTFQGG